MKKLSLRLEALAVESFDTASAVEERGTVEALGEMLRSQNTNCRTWGCCPWTGDPDTTCI